MVMYAIRIHTYGRPEVMQLEELPLPVPGPGQVLVRVHAASVNFLDVQKRRGELAGQAFYQHAGVSESDLPAFLGSQGVGVVEALGPEVSNVKVGDRVSFGGNGTYATHFLAPAARLILIPDGINLDQTAAGLNQGFVAYALTHLAYPVKPGDWCLIQSAAGGIGHLLCQMTKLRGGKVIGVTSTEKKAQAARELGADEVIISTQTNIAKETRRITAGQGVNVIYDGVGKDTFETNLDSLAPRGYLVIYGQASGYIPPFDIMTLQEKGSLFLTRFSGHAYFDEFPRYIQQFATWIKQGQLSVRIDRLYPLADAAQAHTVFEQRETIGRVLLLP